MNIPEAVLRSQIKRGTILHSYLFKENIGHGKFFVVIGINEKYVVGFFFINSRINIPLRGKQEQLDMQYPMRQCDYDFLRYDSFLSATNIEKISIDRLLDSIRENQTELKGEMKQEHIDELLESARRSPLFSLNEKNQFFS